MTDPMSGRQYTIAAAEYHATVASIGASLRTLTAGGRDLVVPFAADQLRPVFRGTTLAPWPNRVTDGRYSFAGQTQQLALTEPDRGHALHGLLSWHDFTVVEHRGDAVELVAICVPQAGYPHRVEVRVRFSVDGGGLTTSVTGTNMDSSPQAGPAPWGTGPHPYLVAGPGLVDDWELALPASSILTVTPERLVPTGLAHVAEFDSGRLDFRAQRRLGDVQIDHAYTDLDRDPHGFTSVRLLAANHHGVAITFDTACNWVQIHTADRPVPTEHRVGLAVEPMTCAPDAFNSGAGLLTLEPGASHTASWRIHAL